MTSLNPCDTTPADALVVGRDRIVFKLTSERVDGDVAVFEVTMPPGGGPPMLHRHGPFELYRVRTGELAFYLEEESGSIARTVAGPGATVPIAGGLEHTIRNESDQEAQATVVFVPGESFERFMRGAADLGRDGAPADEEVLALAETHGIEMTRPIEEALSPTPNDPGCRTA